MKEIIRGSVYCYFCKTELKKNSDNYLWNRYRCKFWNNNPQDERLICYVCLKYSYNRNLPIIAESKFKRKIFKQYERKGLFKQ